MRPRRAGAAFKEKVGRAASRPGYPAEPAARSRPSLRDRATLPSPLRGLDPSGGYPSRLRSLRSLRTPFARRLAALPAAATVRRYVASIAMAHRATGSPEAPRSPAVRLALQRMHRDRGRRQAQAPGLTWPLRQRLVEAAGDRPIDVRNRALLAVAYDTMLRRSELAALRVCDLAVDRTGAATVLVRNSKTDAEGEGAVLYVAPDTMALVAEWRELSGVADGRLFRSLCRGRLGEGLDPSQIPRIYKALARRAGIEAGLADRLSGHSTRVGAAQDMVAHGIELPAIQQAGRWKSTAMATRYGERLLAARGGAAQLARLQGRDRAAARRWPPAPAVPATPPSERERHEPQRPDGQPARQVERQPNGMRPPRTGPDDRHDMPAGALAQTVEEIVRQRLLRSARSRAGDAVRPWPAGGSGAGPSRPDACAPTASRAGPGTAAAPRDRVSAPSAACPGRAIEDCCIRIDARSAFAARAPP